VVNLRYNERYARVCFDPLSAEGTARVDFYHHTHAQTERSPGVPADTPVLGTEEE